VALAYVALGGAFQAVLHRPWPIALTTRRFATLWLLGSTLWFVEHWIARRRRTAATLSGAQFGGAVLLGSLAIPVQITFQSLKQSLGRQRGFPWDTTIAAVDKTLHGEAAWRWYSWVLDSPVMLKIVDMLYLAWFPVLLSVLVWLCWTPHRLLRQRAILAFLILWIGAGTIGAWAFASAGPCYRTSIDPDAAELVYRLDASHAALLARRNQQAIWEAFKTDQWLQLGGISAMPSLHVGFVVLVAIMMQRRSRTLGSVCWIYAACVHVGAVVLGWHYAIDGYAGALSAYAAWILAGRLVGIPRGLTGAVGSGHAGARLQTRLMSTG
jgi:membrane-associated phospholipid phosphatase